MESRNCLHQFRISFLLLLLSLFFNSHVTWKMHEIQAPFTIPIRCSNYRRLDDDDVNFAKKSSNESKKNRREGRTKPFKYLISFEFVFQLGTKLNDGNMHEIRKSIRNCVWFVCIKCFFRFSSTICQVPFSNRARCISNFASTEIE